MRSSAYIVVTIATIFLYCLAARYELEKGASVQWGLFKAGFDLLFLVPLELLAFSMLAQLFNHSSRQIFGRLFKRVGLAALGILILLMFGTIVVFVYALGGLPGVAH